MKRVALVEVSDFSTDRIGETIPPDASALLQKLGVIERFAADGHVPCYGSRSLWGSNTLGHNDFLVSPYGHGWHLDRKRFDKMLFKAAIDAGAQPFATRCKKIETSAECVTAAHLSNGETVEAEWFLDATGRESLLPRSMGISRQVDDKQVVIWSRFQINPGSLGQSTWLEAVPYGWWYAAELPGNIAIVALGTDGALAKSMGTSTLQGWVVAFSGTALIAPQVRTARLVPNSFGITASQSYRTRRVAGPNWRAAGDAASALDPLLSAGIYKALSSGIRAAETILDGQDGTAYGQDVATDHAVYLDARATLYDAEQRWLDQPFWQQRCRGESVASVSGSLGEPMRQR